VEGKGNKERKSYNAKETDPCEPGLEWFGLYRADGITPCLGEIEAISFVDNNPKGRLPDNWEVYTSLKKLIFQDARGLETTIPPSIFLSTLDTLTLKGVSLEGQIPEEVGNATNLVSLTISNGKKGLGHLSGSIPSVLSRLSSLEHLDFSFSGQLEWPPPEELSHIDTLKSIDFQFSFLRNEDPVGIEDWWCNISRLQDLRLGYNFLGSTIPRCFSTLTYLVNLDLAQNSITGELLDISAFSRVVNLNLNGNQFTGTLPEAWSRAKNLRVLDLSANSLSGELPPTWGQLHLESFVIYFNSFVGTIPTSWFDMPLQRLWISSNNFSGTFPDEFCKLKDTMRRFSIALNQFSGTLPQCFSNFTNVFVIEAYNNRLEGQLPDLSQLDKLKSMTFNDNNLSGTLPALSIECPITGLNIRNNRIGGTIPSSFGLVTRLTSIDVANNMISGTMESSLFTNKVYLILSHNLLEGFVPDEMCSVNYVNLEENPLLSCPLPSCCKFNGNASCAPGLFAKCCPDECTLLPLPQPQSDDGLWPLERTPSIVLYASLALLVGALAVMAIVGGLRAVGFEGCGDICGEVNSLSGNSSMQQNNKRPPGGTGGSAGAVSPLVYYRWVKDGVVGHQDLKVGRVLGRGRYSTVHEATFRGMVVVAKEYNVRRKKCVIAQAMEGIVLQSLAHPHIRTMYGVCLSPADSKAWTLLELMEYCLYDFIHLGPTANRYSIIKPPEKAGIALQISRAVAHLHDQVPPIVHGDISSVNVFLNADSYATKLGGFELTRTPGSKKHFLEEHDVQVYIGPHLEESSSESDADRFSMANDLVCLGSLIFEVLTGRQLSEETEECISVGSSHPDLARLSRRLLLLVRRLLRAPYEGGVSAMDAVLTLEEAVSAMPAHSQSEKKFYGQHDITDKYEVGSLHYPSTRAADSSGNTGDDLAFMMQPARR